MRDIWELLLELDRDLPVWFRYLVTAGGAIGLSRLIPRLWRWLHNRRKPFRCGPLVWKRNEEGDVYAGLRAAKYEYPIWSSGKWVEDVTPPAADREADEKKDCEEDQRDAD